MRTRSGASDPRREWVVVDDQGREVARFADSDGRTTILLPTARATLPQAGQDDPIDLTPLAGDDGARTTSVRPQGHWASTPAVGTRHGLVVVSRTLGKASVRLVDPDGSSSWEDVVRDSADSQRLGPDLSVRVAPDGESVLVRGSRADGSRVHRLLDAATGDLISDDARLDGSRVTLLPDGAAALLGADRKVTLLSRGGHVVSAEATLPDTLVAPVAVPGGLAGIDEPPFQRASATLPAAVDVRWAVADPAGSGIVTVPFGRRWAGGHALTGTVHMDPVAGAWVVSTEWTDDAGRSPVLGLR